MLLAVIMLLSVMPVAYAERATYSPEIEQYIEIRIKMISYLENLYELYMYESNGWEEMYNIIEEPRQEYLSLGYELPELSYKNIKSINKKALSDFNRIMQPAIDEVEAKIANGEINIVIDTYKFWKYYFSFFVYYDEDEMKRVLLYIDDTENEKYIELYLMAADSFNNELFAYRAEHPRDVEMTQADFDAIYKEKFTPFFDMLINCLDGNHPYGEYISNNDATEEADGTKTATCEFCGATDTVIDEGSKLVKEPASFFERLIEFIKSLIAKILAIFS